MGDDEPFVRDRIGGVLTGRFVLNTHGLTEPGTLPVYPDGDEDWCTDTCRGQAMRIVVFDSDDYPQPTVVVIVDDQYEPFLTTREQCDSLGIPICNQRDAPGP
jgi:hypothetical protein